MVETEQYLLTLHLIYIDSLFMISLAHHIQKGTLKIATFQKGGINLKKIKLRKQVLWMVYFIEHTSLFRFRHNLLVDKISFLGSAIITQLSVSILVIRELVCFLNFETKQIIGLRKATKCKIGKFAMSTSDMNSLSFIST